MPGIIPFILPVHVVAAVLGLVLGFVALYAAKGAKLHRQAGILFVYAMIPMSLLGALMAWVGDSWRSVSVTAGLLTFYMVVTSLLTVRRRTEHSQRIDTAAVIVALAIAVLAFTSAFTVLGTGRPDVPAFIFGAVALLAAIGDIRMMRAGGIQGASRISRHLWRMCFALWVTAASFFLGPPRRVPEIIRIPALLPLPVLVPVIAMLYWLWRIRIKRTLSSLVLRDRYETALKFTAKEPAS